jgi:hypothetical protein
VFLRRIGDGANFEVNTALSPQRADHAKQIPRGRIFACELESRYGTTSSRNT